MKKRVIVAILSGIVTMGFVLFSASSQEVGKMEVQIFFDSIPGGTFGIILRNLGLQNVSASEPHS